MSSSPILSNIFYVHVLFPCLYRLAFARQSVGGPPVYLTTQHKDLSFTVQHLCLSHNLLVCEGSTHEFSFFQSLAKGRFTSFHIDGCWLESNCSIRENDL